jgi:hypothetical protein
MVARLNESANGITVFSGGTLAESWMIPPAKLERVLNVRAGTAANSLVDVFNAIARKRHCCLTYVIPISDNGGSSSELIRFVGGPSK